MYAYVCVCVCVCVCVGGWVGGCVCVYTHLGQIYMETLGLGGKEINVEFAQAPASGTNIYLFVHSFVYVSIYLCIDLFMCVFSYLFIQINK